MVRVLRHTHIMFGRSRFYSILYSVSMASFFLAGCLQTNGDPAGVTTSAATIPLSPIQGDLGLNGSVSCGSPQNSFQCMMCNCHHETEGETDAGQLAVGKVVMTRVGMPSYPNTVCGVIYQQSQFSWTLSSRKRRETISGASYQNCYQPVVQALRFRGHYASHFHTSGVHSSWASRCRRLERIGNHIFYEGCPGEGRAPAATPAPAAVAKLDFLGNEEHKDLDETKNCYR